MKYALSGALAFALSASATSAEVVAAGLALAERGAPANQPHGYVPQTVSCPQDQPTIRSAATLSDSELSWLQTRRNATIDPMRNLLSRMNIAGLDTNAYIDKYRNNASALPNIGLAMAGGGYRALLVGAGVIEAFDSRTPNSTAPGQLGGLLQATTYLSGLSGGGWLVGSLYANNFTSVYDIINRASSNPKQAGNLWQFDQTIFEGPDSDGIQLFSTVDYAGQVVGAVQGKKDAGFDTTITDYWGRTLSYQLINDTDGGVAYTFSSLASQDFITGGSAPLPLLVADGRTPGKNVISLNSTIFTFSPWELGSEDPNLYAFAPLKYVGTNFSNGVPAKSDSCVVGFDNYGYVMGTSSSLFNAILTTANSTASSATGLLSNAFKSAISSIVTAIGQTEEDIADWPNPFRNYRSGSNRISQSDMLTLVDGGEDGQNIPLHPLIQPYRHVDVIFAVDNSADTNKSYPTDQSAAYWPAGVSLIATYERSLGSVANGTAFPAIPDESTFLNLGLANRPTFFGCNASNITGTAPLIVYLPNGPYVYNANFSTFDLDYSDSQRDAVVRNAYNLATQGNSSLDANWPACVGCAILSRSMTRTGTQVPQICNQCFDRYCWNGTRDSRPPGNYVPQMKLKEIANAAGRVVTASVSLSLIAAFVVGASLL